MKDKIVIIAAISFAFIISVGIPLLRPYLHCEGHVEWHLLGTWKCIPEVKTPPSR